MRRVWLTAGYELRTTLRKRSFWLTTFLLPAVVLALVFIPQLLAGSDGQSKGLAERLAVPGAQGRTLAIGYLDPAGLLATEPTGLPPGMAVKYHDEAHAQEALARGDIDRYYIVPADYVSSGRLTVVEARYQPLRVLDNPDLIKYVINTGITGKEGLAALLVEPTPGLQSTALNPTSAGKPADSTLSYILPYLLMFILYMALAMTSGFMLQSVSKEKENRTAEMLLVSIKPRQMMLGKIAGLSAVGLLQVAVWLAVFFGVVSGRGILSSLDLTGGGSTVVRTVPWTVAYFLLGYLMYASIYAALGALAPSARDANQFVFVAIIPLVIPLLFSSTFADAPNGALATTLSLFPLTSPVSMVARLGAGAVPWWQALAGLVAVAVFAYLFVLLAARLFRADNLLSSRALSWARLAGELRGRALRPALARAGGGPSLDAIPTRRETVREPERRLASPTPRRAAASRQRVAIVFGAAVLCLVIGVVESSRGESSGIFIAVWGVVLAGIGYWRWRRG